MASLSGYYNSDDKPASFEALPAGDYLAAIIESEMKPTKAGTGEYLKLVWEILDGQYKGRRLYENLNLQNPSPKAQEIARGQFAAIRKATGVLNPGDSADLHNVPAILVVGNKKDDDGNPQNHIKAHKSRNAAAPPEQATTPAAKAPWMTKT